MLLWTPDRRTFRSDEDEAVLWRTVAPLAFLDLLPCPAALVVPHRLPVEQRFSETHSQTRTFLFFYAHIHVVYKSLDYFHFKTKMKWD